jgi:hypothetical protein
MATLEQLASREHWCGTEIGQIRATNPYFVLPGDRSAVYDPIVKEWHEIHAAYLEIAGATLADAREALKRALFIQWYEVAEPFFLTGILDLDNTLKARVLTMAETGLRDDDDVELKEMVAWYGAIADNAFNPSSTGPLFRHFCTRGANLSWLTSDDQRNTYPGRGLMGEYFMSLNRPAR